MANPTASAVHTNTPLTNLSVGHWGANAGKYAAFRLFPAVGVMKQSDKYYTYTKADLLRSQAARRGAGAPIEIGGYGVSDDSYFCDRWALGRDIDDPTRNNADPQFDLDGEAVEFLTDQIALACESQWIEEFFTTSVWGVTDQTGVATNPGANQFLQFNDMASTPIEVFRSRITAIESGTGRRPNKLGLGARVWAALADHPDLLDRIKYTERGVVGPDLLAALLELDEVVVLRSVENSAADGATASYDYTAGKHALMLYSTPNPGIRSVTAGLSFVWTAGGHPLQGARIKRYRIEERESDRVEAEKYVDFKAVSTDLGAFMSAAVA